MEAQKLGEEIAALKKKLGAVIVAHNYQRPEVQDIADYLGDSLELSRRCAEAHAKTIIFCGVRFMAETAAILNPRATVLLAVAGAGCPMADMIDANKLREWKAKYPKATVVAYINTTAAVKAGSDICCTSANAIKVVASLPDEEILFVPDEHLGRYVSTKVSGKRFILYPGYCIAHARLRAEEVKLAKEKYPKAEVLVHPECRAEVIELADAVLSTSQMVRYAHESPAQEFLIGTEEGLLYRLRRENPLKKFYLISPRLYCANMKKTTLEGVLQTMKLGRNRVSVPEGIRLRAKEALDRMLAVV